MKENNDNNLLEQPNFVELFFNCLDSKTKLVYRCVNKKTQAAVRQNVVGPYRSKKKFLLASSGLFSEKKYFDTAWKNYSKTIKSNSERPALLYRMKDWDNIIKNRELDAHLEPESFSISGRIYSPEENHKWIVNQFWLLAQFHKARSFILLSEFNAEVKINAATFTSFGKEVGCAFKMGYQVSQLMGYQVEISPTNPFNQHKIRINDLTVATDDILGAVEKINFIFEQDICALRVVNELESIKQKLTNYLLADLQALKEDEVKQTKEIDEIINDVNCSAQFLMSFRKHLAGKQSYSAKLFSEKLHLDKDFLNKSNVELKTLLIQHLKERINQLINFKLIEERRDQTYQLCLKT